MEEYTFLFQAMKYTEILINIRKIIRSVNLESKRIEKEYGVSIPQLLCLSYLHEKESFQASHKEIKDFLQLNASTVTGIISRLEKKGLIARLPRHKDRRVVMVTITSKGAKLLDSAPEPMHDRLLHKLEQLSEEKLASLQDAFALIIDFLNIENVDAAPIITAAPDISSPE